MEILQDRKLQCKTRDWLVDLKSKYVQVQIQNNGGQVRKSTHMIRVRVLIMCSLPASQRFHKSSVVQSRRLFVSLWQTLHQNRFVMEHCTHYCNDMYFFDAAMHSNIEFRVDLCAACDSLFFTPSCWFTYVWRK